MTIRTRTMLLGRPRRTTRTALRRPRSVRLRLPLSDTVTRRTVRRRALLKKWIVIARRVAPGRAFGAGVRAAEPLHLAEPTATVACWSISRDERPTITP